jgi:drug/metabolite transporter (DMT)-like permease
VFTVAVALLLGRERATLTKLLGLGLALLGALTVTGWSRFQGSSTVFIGNLLILCNSLSYSIYLVISREILARYRALTVIAFTFLFGTLGVVPFGLGEFVRDAPHLHPGTWVALGYIVAFPSVGTYLLNTYALARVESSLVAIYIYLQPALGALLALTVLDERPTLGTVLGCGLIFGGIWLVGQDARRRARRTPPAGSGV